MANLLFVNSRYQQMPGLADWIIADLPGLVISDYFPFPRSLVAPSRGAGGFVYGLRVISLYMYVMYAQVFVYLYVYIQDV